MWTLARCRIIIFLILTLKIIANAQSRGSPCNHIEKGVPGICKELVECSDAIKDLESRAPQVCGYEDYVLIVCCPLETASTAEEVGKKSRQACEIYKDLPFTKMRSPILLPDAEDEKKYKCPWKRDPRVIYQGRNTTKGEFPHMALLGYGTWPDNYGWACGGSLISDKFVLTAAHCLFWRKHGHVRFVRLGDIDYSNPNDDEYMQQINIKNRIKHPDYKSREHYHDLALLELEYKAEINLYVKPICLYIWEPKEKLKTGIVTGWGLTDHVSPSEMLLKGAVQYFPPKNCSHTYKDAKKLSRNLDENSQICFGPLTTETDTCPGDSGGPIQIYNDDFPCSYYIFGVTSFGQSCGINGIPGVYVNLHNYIEWIEGIVWK